MQCFAMVYQELVATLVVFLKAVVIFYFSFISSSTWENEEGYVTRNGDCGQRRKVSSHKDCYCVLNTNSCTYVEYCHDRSRLFVLSVTDISWILSVDLMNGNFPSFACF